MKSKVFSFIFFFYCSIWISVQAEDTSKTQVNNTNADSLKYPLNANVSEVEKDTILVSGDSLFPPYDGKLSRGFFRGHPGLDIPLRMGDSIHAAWKGIVTSAGMNFGGYGNLVIVQHTNELETYYAHMSKVLVEVGDTVDAGTVLGLGGSTGNSTGPHLHFETRINKVAVDPQTTIANSGSDYVYEYMFAQNKNIYFGGKYYKHYYKSKKFFKHKSSRLVKNSRIKVNKETSLKKSNVKKKSSVYGKKGKTITKRYKGSKRR